MGAMASQITSLTVVYSTVYWGSDQRKHQQIFASLAFTWEEFTSILQPVKSSCLQMRYHIIWYSINPWLGWNYLSIPKLQRYNLIITSMSRIWTAIWAPSQYPKRRLSVRSRKVSKPRDLYLELSDCSEIWQALRQQCCRCACQISKRYDNLKYQSRGFETLRDLTKRRLFGYWDGALVPGVFYGVHFGWPIHDFHVLVLHEIPSASGCVGQNIILDQDKAVLEGGSCPQ